MRECDIYNSSDSTLSNAKPNDISVILSSAKINAIFCNGRKAYELFMRFFNAQMGWQIQIFLLPSSSPANARYSYKKACGIVADSARVCTFRESSQNIKSKNKVSHPALK